jgi:hypothetical protein
MSEKMNYAWPVTSENAVVYNCFLEKIERIKTHLQGKRIAVFGAGIRGCCLAKILGDNGYRNIVFVDNNPEKQGNRINSCDIISFELALREPEQIFLVAPENAQKICAQLTTAGLKENVDWFSFSVSAYRQYLAEYQRPLQDYFLVMGDCAFTHIALEDENFDSLGTMIRNKAGAGRCKVLDMHGMGQQAYYHIARSLLERREKPDKFLLLLMIETMAPKVPIMPRTQHPELIRALADTSPNPNPEFVAYAELAQDRFDRFQLEAFASFDDKTSQKSEKLYMQVNYLFRYRETAEGVVYLKKTIRMMNREDIPVILYVPPVNYWQGESLFGSNFKASYETNFKKLYASLDQEGLQYEVIDASYLLTLDDFAAPNTIDETCRYSGRQKIMQYLGGCASLKKYLGQ